MKRFLVITILISMVLVLGILILEKQWEGDFDTSQNAYEFNPAFE
ncbi:MAG TPA: hypothetical protein VJ916_02365 [Anaerovoracaceae bacterium]|nr:hypothetical protein [Anaerovoracaceae bacterium]